MTEKVTPRLMLVTDRLRTRDSLINLIAEAVEGGVDAVQIREKDLSQDELFALAGAVAKVCGSRAQVLVNGAPLVAAKLGLGLHLPERSMDLASARLLLGPEAVIGRSVHSPVAVAASSGSDYVLAGHIFETASKPGRQPIGLEGLREMVDAASDPVLAIGGIDLDRIPDVIDAGAAGVAMIGAFTQAEHPGDVARRARALLDRAVQARKLVTI